MFAFLRVRNLFCDDPDVAWMPPTALLAVQAASSGFAFIFLGPPVAEIVSAAPGYFRGLRDLAGCRIYKAVLSHLLIEYVIFGAAARAIYSLEGDTCDPLAIAELWGLARAQVHSWISRLAQVAWPSGDGVALEGRVASHLRT
jgi:hypothetical protein